LWSVFCCLSQDEVQNHRRILLFHQTVGGRDDIFGFEMICNKAVIIYRSFYHDFEGAALTKKNLRTLWLHARCSLIFAFCFKGGTGFPFPFHSD
jgi:hypothetical protein